MTPGLRARLPWLNEIRQAASVSQHPEEAFAGAGRRSDSRSLVPAVQARRSVDSHRRFYGNALADWLGSLMIVITTKYFYEAGSPESRRPHPRTRSALMRFVIDHSLTIVLVITGAAWAALYRAM